MKKSAAIISFMTAVSSLSFTGAIAENLVIPLPEETKVEKTEAVYQCGSEKVGATYLTTGDVGLVRIAFAGRIIVASSVISGSGAKYQGGAYVWWSKGEEADLYDLMADPQMQKPLHCAAIKS